MACTTVTLLEIKLFSKRRTDSALFKLKRKQDSASNCKFALIALVCQKYAENIDKPFSVKMVRNSLRNCVVCLKLEFFVKNVQKT